MPPLQHFIVIMAVLALCQFMPRHFRAGALTLSGFAIIAAFAPAAALFILLSATEAALLVLWLGRIDRKSSLRKNLPYVILLNLFFVDIHQLMFGVPLAMLAVSFSMIRIFMTAKQILNSRKALQQSDVVWIYAAAFFLPAIIIGPVFSGTDLKKQHRDGADTAVVLRDYRMILQGLILSILASPFLGELQTRIPKLADALFVPDSVGHGVVTGISDFFFTTWILLFLQLFAAFWGQSLVAEHTSRMFGFRLPVNFDCPWKARTIQEFWKRWHRSMAQFVLQYIFLPLNLRGISPKLATIAAFVFMGLWHNLSFGYFVWGLCHGMLLVFVPDPGENRLKQIAFRLLLWVCVITLSYSANYGPYS